MSLVGLVECKVRDAESIKRAVREALNLIDYSLPKARKIVIKPNMCYYWDWSTGQTTDPVFVAALIELFREEIASDVEISIVESDASAMKCKYAFKYLGYEKLAKEYGVDLVNLSDVEAEKATVEVGGEVFEFSVPRIIRDADLHVNVPKMKYMSFTKISAALKNIFGCNPYPKKFQYHSKLDEVIVALNKAMPFNLHVLDGLTVCGSKTLRLGLVMASRDSVAMDAVAATIMGVNPKSVAHLRLAEKEGLGKTAFTVKGVDIDYFRHSFPKKSLPEKAVALGYMVACKLGLDKRLI
ncbi:MAG: DUF362 domain-containing protein [Candidatus Bathyarchaeota archaeon]|nr:DUF362 domain-containing protein [Candidatus Bathyarchaeota archaeon]